MMSFGFPPKGWALCNGQLLPIAQNQALFSLLGTSFGGDGRATFGLPNLQGRVPVYGGAGRTYNLGQAGGQENHTITIGEMAAHTHQASGSSAAASSPAPANAVLANATNMYGAPANLTPLRAEAITSAGGSQPHNNMQPYLVTSFCIALQGIFPSQS
jgi:microcystin-dependent protein